MSISVPATSSSWTLITSGIDLSTISQYALTTTGTVNVNQPSDPQTPAGSTTWDSTGYAFPVPATTFAPLHSGSSAQYGMALLFVPTGTVPAAAPDAGGSLYTTAIAAPGSGPTVYTAAQLQAIIGASSGKYDAYAICSDNKHSDNSGAWSVTATVTLIPLPAAPVLAGSVTACAAALSWVAVSTATSYRIYRSDNGGPMRLMTTVTGTAWTDTTAALRQTFTYDVTAVNGVGEGLASNQVTLSPALAAPVLAWSGVCEGNQATITWGTVAGATGYRIYRLRDWGHDAPSFVPLDTTVNPPMPLPGDPAAQPLVTPDAADAAPVLVYDGSGLSVVDTGVKCGRRYVYQAYAYCGCGTSPATAPLPVTPCCIDKRAALPPTTGWTRQTG